MVGAWRTYPRVRLAVAVAVIVVAAWPAVAAGTTRRLIHALRGRIYHTGDRISVTVTAPGWAPEHAVIRIRSGRLPAVRAR